MSEELVLEAFNRGKAFGYAEGLKIKKLSDDEIIDIADTFDWSKDCAVVFARAILKKAGEK